MSARILDGKLLSDAIRREVAERAAGFLGRTGVRPHLAAVLVGDDPASQIYVKNKRQACEKAGLESSLHRLPNNASQAELVLVIRRLNDDTRVHGILVQLPLPAGLDETAAIHSLDPDKDVDALHPTSVGLIAQGIPRFLPCTPYGVQQILVRSAIPIAGQHVVIVGRSGLVGTPLALMLSRKGADATVTLCHSRTRDLASICRQADILIAAIGKPEFIRGDMIREGATVIDVGINRLDGGRIVGDVHFESAAQVAGAITPVPGGVGRMTVSMLLENTLKAAEWIHGSKA